MVGSVVWAEFFTTEDTVEAQTSVPQRLLTIILAPLVALRAKAMVATVSAEVGAQSHKDMLKRAAGKLNANKPKVFRKTVARAKRNP